MTDEQRRHISNGIWLCRECARLVDADEVRFPAELLIDWKRNHERWIRDGKPDDPAREVIVKNGGTGSVVINDGPGIGLDVQRRGKGPAERIVVHGSGTGEIITNTGQGIGKRVVSSGDGPASEARVDVDRPVKLAVGLCSTVISTVCSSCGRAFQLSKVVRAFAGDEIPKMEMKCPNCGETNLV